MIGDGCWLPGDDDVRAHTGSVDAEAQAVPETGECRGVDQR